MCYAMRSPRVVRIPRAFKRRTKSVDETADRSLKLCRSFLVQSGERRRKWDIRSNEEAKRAVKCFLFTLEREIWLPDLAPPIYLNVPSSPAKIRERESTKHIPPARRADRLRTLQTGNVRSRGARSADQNSVWSVVETTLKTPSLE